MRAPAAMIRLRLQAPAAILEFQATCYHAPYGSAIWMRTLQYVAFPTFVVRASEQASAAIVYKGNQPLPASNHHQSAQITNQHAPPSCVARVVATAFVVVMRRWCYDMPLNVVCSTVVGAWCVRGLV